MKPHNFFNEIYRILFLKKYHILTEKELRQRDENISRGICKNLAKGSIALINGKYMTSRQLEDRRNANLNYHFSD